MLQVIDFWQAQGVDGFRFDVINFLSTRGIGPDNPEKAGVQQHEHDVNQPGLIGTLQRVCQHARQQGDVFLIGEIGSEEREILARYQAPSLMDVVFNFNIGSQKTFDAARLCDEINATLALQSGLPTLFFSSHDMPRMISRFGEGPHDAARALAVLALQLTVRGVPFIFQGDELGMPDYVPQTVGQIFDIQGKPSTTRPCGRGAVPPTRWRRPLNIHGMGPVPPSSGATHRLRAFPPPRRGCPSARTIPCSMPNIRYRRPARCGVSTRPSLRFGPPSGRYSMGSAAR